MIEVITGDLLDAKEKYIVHQTNCISTGASGIARAIFDRFPYADFYSTRITPDQPGHIIIRGNGQDQRYVVGLNGQYYPGTFRTSSAVADDQKTREKHFYHGLLRLVKVLDLESVALPWHVGCGLAGGCWDNYIRLLDNMEEYLEQQGVRVAIYRRPEDGY
jgi:O-acetyl-ADP-ribose deacetylase (regulator of RNase III)